MDLHHRFPKLGFAKRAMPPEVYAGITKRVERVQREIADPDRRNWFRHHFGTKKHKTKADLFEVLSECKDELKGYPHRPWTTSMVRDSRWDTCTRRICCGWKHPEARRADVILSDAEYEAFKRAAYRKGLFEGDLLGDLVKRYLAECADSTEESES